jgi:hypothetical protein
MQVFFVLNFDSGLIIVQGCDCKYLIFKGIINKSGVCVNSTENEIVTNDLTVF